MSLPNTSFNIGQFETVTANPEDAGGNAGLFVASTIPAWTAAPAGIITMVVASNGLSAVVTAWAPGVATVNVNGESSNGAAINSQFTVTVVANPATQFAFTFGAPA